MAAFCLPEISADRVPFEGLRASGAPRSLFIKLWTIASCDYVDGKYCKSDWLELEALLFTDQRTEAEKHSLADLATRLWETASEMPEYNEQDWCSLRGMIHMAR